MHEIPLSREKFPKTWEILNEGLKDQVAPGFVVGFWDARVPDAITVGAWGARRVIPSEQPMEIGTTFDLASVTKVLGTTALLGRLIDRGWIGWDTRVRSILQDFGSSEVTIRHLASHSSGLVWWRPYFERYQREYGVDAVWRAPVSERQKLMRQWILAEELESKPGTQPVYSDPSYMLLGFVLEEVTGLPIDQAIERWIWKPLEMDGAFFRRVDRPVEKGILEFVAATEQCPWRKGVLQGQVHDDNCWGMGGYSGHAGGFGTAMDVLKFGRAVFSGFFTRETTARFFERVGSASSDRTHGWMLRTPGGSTGQYFSTHTIGHLGYTGTSLWIDGDAGLAVTILSNRVHPTRTNEKIKTFRPKVHDAIRLDLAGD